MVSCIILKAAFDNTLFRESSSSRLELHFDDPRNAIPLLFEYMYTGELKAELHMLIPLIHASEQLLCMELITQLKGTLRQFLSALERPSTSPASPSHLLQCNHITAALISSLPDVPVAVPHSSSSSLSLTFSDIYDHDDIEDSTISTTSRILGGTGGGGGIRGGNRGMRRGSGSLFGLPELADGTDDMNAINNNSYSNTNHLFQISTVLGMLKDALFFGMSDVAKSIVDLIASRLDELPVSSLNIISYNSSQQQYFPFSKDESRLVVSAI